MEITNRYIYSIPVSEDLGMNGEPPGGSDAFARLHSDL